MAILALVAPPAQATGSSENGPWSSVLADAPTRDGVDFDAACLVNHPLAVIPLPNHYRSDASGVYVGCPQTTGLRGVSLYDGSTEATDLNSADLTTFLDAYGEVWLQGTVVVDDNIPAAGTTSFTQADLDTPDETFRGIGLKVLFQNRDKQHNADNPSGGCHTVDGRKQRDQSGHWRDGWHYFLGFDVTHDGAKYVHSVSVGTYDPTPDGGFFFDELGVNDGPVSSGLTHGGATNDDPFQPKGPASSGGRWTYSVQHNTPVLGQSTVTIRTTGLVRNADDLCGVGYHTTDYGSENAGVYSSGTYTGDRLFDIKGLSTANQVAVLPVTVPLTTTCTATSGLICESDLTSIGGLVFFSDTTKGCSAGSNSDCTPPGVNVRGTAYTGGLLGAPDTLGESHTCPTPTVGGLLDDNPFWAASPNTACEIDDHAVGRGSLLSEWWETDTHYTIP